MATQNITNAVKNTFKYTSATKPALYTNVKLDTTNEGFVLLSTESPAATDIIIGSITNVEACGNDSTWIVTVALSCPIVLMACTGAIAIGDFLKLDTAGLLIAATRDTSAPSTTIFSYGISLKANTSGGATLPVLAMNQHIGV